MPGFQVTNKYRIHLPELQTVFKEIHMRGLGKNDIALYSYCNWQSNYSYHLQIVDTTISKRGRIYIFLKQFCECWQLGNPNKMFRFPSPSTSKGWVGRWEKNNQK